jgi:xanthine permease XanP
MTPARTMEADAPPSVTPSRLIYGLHARPPVWETLMVAVQHVMAVFVGIITPPLIICNAIGLDPVGTRYVVSMSLFVSGIATFIQVRRFGPVGSGLLSIQGTSFSFVGPILSAGLAVTGAGGSPEDALSLIFGLCFFGAFVEVMLSRFLHLARQVFTPLVTGTIVSIIGLTLIRVGVTSMGGGVPALNDGSFGSLPNLAVAGLVLAVVILFNCSRNPYVRMSSVVAGLVAGYLLSLPLGLVNFSSLSGLPLVAAPIPFRYGMGFDFVAFIPFILLYLITAIESIGDITATAAVSGEPVEGRLYMRRIKGGVLGDGLNSALAAVFNTFPNTSFSQNNGVIQITGVGSRYVGLYIAGILTVLGLFPVVSGIFQTVIMFGSIVVAGINILSTIELDRRALIIISASLAMGLGVTYVPEILDQLPDMLRGLLSSGISAGGLTAIALNWIIPTTIVDPTAETLSSTAEPTAESTAESP